MLNMGAHHFRALWIAGNPSELCCRCRAPKKHPVHYMIPMGPTPNTAVR